MPAQLTNECPHVPVRPLGTLTNVPAAWIDGTPLPEFGADLESGWCMRCKRYLWRELGCPYWLAFDPPRPR